MLYTTNFAFVGLCEAAKATNDSTYVKAVNQMRDFLIRIQVKSDKFRNVDGAWFRAFNYQDWNYWAANADAGWGAWSNANRMDTKLDCRHSIPNWRKTHRYGNYQTEKISLRQQIKL